MKLLQNTPYYLLALVFLVFGLNFFFHFIPMPPMEGDSATYFTLMAGSGYMAIVKILEIICAILLLIPKTRALGLVILAPIVVNIVLFELCIAKQPQIGILLLIINAIGLYLNRDKYKSILS
jgi:hypothetical protein